MTLPPAASDADPIAELDTAACGRLLAAKEFGRLAVVDAGKPMIIVLNHLVDGADILLRTRDDARLARMTADGLQIHAAFEVDSAFPVSRAGWSVIATGLLGQEADPDRVRRARTKLEVWAQGDRDVVLRLGVNQLTGRRVGPA
jgi:uncharacterized protein